MFEKKLIQFSSSYYDWLLPPVPTKKLVPDWFKKIKSYAGEIDNYQTPTVKKCMPFLDSLTSGYIIRNPVDIVFWKDGDEIFWELPRSFDQEFVRKINIGIQTHTSNQVSMKAYRQGEITIPFKWMNPWFIKTPKNYSCLFTNPLNGEKDRIRIFDAIVDTDTYDSSQINFPFALKSIPDGKSFILEKGYPIALVFPFLRDSWKMNIKKHSSTEIKEIEKSHFKMFTVMYDNYKRFFWKSKKYD